MPVNTGTMTGPMSARMIGNWSRCSLVKVSCERREPSKGRMAVKPYIGNALRARKWIGSCGLQKSSIVSPSQFAFAHRSEQLLQQHEGEEHLEGIDEHAGGPGGAANVRDLQQVPAGGQVEQIDQTIQVNEGVSEEVQETAAGLAHVEPGLSDRGIQSLVEQREAADGGQGRDRQQRQPDPIPVTRSR